MSAPSPGTPIPAAAAAGLPSIGWGLLGTGGICGRMALALSQVADARLAAVGSRDLARAEAFVAAQRERHPLARAIGDYRALVADPGVDVVYVGTPHPDHAASVRLALDAGKAVLCEKPFTLTAREAASLAALARERGVFLMEAMWTRCLPALVEAKRLVDAGAVGEPLSAAADFGFASDVPPAHRLLDPALGGGALLDLGIYPLSFASLMLGPIADARATARRGPTGVDVHTAFQLVHAGGGVSQGLCSLVGTTPQAAVVVGSAGRLEIEAPFYAATALRVWRVSPGFRTPMQEERIACPLPGDGFVPQVQEVHRCLHAGLRESPRMPLDESVALMGWMDEMRRQVGVRYPGEDA